MSKNKSYIASLIIPCFNNESCIERCITSLTSESMFADIEVLIVDSGSTDNSISIIEQYATQNENIKLLKSGSGEGDSKPFDKGLKAASGQYIMFMNPEDMAVNDGHSVLINTVQEHGSDILIAKKIGKDAAGQIAWQDELLEQQYFNQKNVEMIRMYFTRRSFITNAIFTHDLIKNNKIKFDEKISLLEDKVFEFQCMYYAEKLSEINDIVSQSTVETASGIIPEINFGIYEELPEVIKVMTKLPEKMFSRQVVIDNILFHLELIYLPMLAKFNDHKDIILACDNIRHAFKKYGFGKMKKNASPSYQDLIYQLKKSDYAEIIAKSFIKDKGTKQA